MHNIVLIKNSLVRPTRYFASIDGGKMKPIKRAIGRAILERDTFKITHSHCEAFMNDFTKHETFWITHEGALNDD